MDLGSIAYATEAVHGFAVTNVGDSPLSVEVLKANCGCALGEFENAQLPPGATTEIGITVSQESPRAYVTLSTNDPERSTIDLRVEAVFAKSVEVQPPNVSFEDCDGRKTYTREVVVTCRRSSEGSVPKAVAFAAEGPPSLELRLVDETRSEDEARYRYEVALKPAQGSFSGMHQLRLSTDARDRPEVSVPVEVGYAYALRAEPAMTVLRIGEAAASVGRVTLTGKHDEGRLGELRVLDPRLAAHWVGETGTVPDLLEVSLVDGKLNAGFRGTILVLDGEGYTVTEVSVLAMSTR